MLDEVGVGSVAQMDDRLDATDAKQDDAQAKPAAPSNPGH